MTRKKRKKCQGKLNTETSGRTNAIIIIILSRLPRDTGTGTGDESSYSSFSSFLKTDDSMRSSDETEPGFCGKTGMVWEKFEDKSERRPLRKVSTQNLT